ncbi:MAG: heavy-metal-associated domain-containing protein [Cyclobacteriaceae bacterium]|nr:heavy-metal-associated domain-containing protein [Cyclobacteriaceae bacterium]
MIKLKSHYFQVVLTTVLLLICSKESKAGIQWVEVGVNGLTCSMCTRSVEMSIRKLEFVDSVVMNLETTEGRIFLRPNVPFNLGQIAKAIVKAGFSVQFVKIRLDMDDITIHPTGVFVHRDQTFHWIDYSQVSKKQTTLKIINEGFLPKKEARKFKKKTEMLKKNSAQDALYVVEDN